MRLISQWKRLSLRTKSTLLIEGLVVLVVLVTGIITTIREKETLEEELEQRGLALAADLAKFASRPLLTKDLPTLRRFVNHSMEQDYVLYVMLVDPQSKVIMHSDLTEISKTLSDALTTAAVNSDEPGCTPTQVPEAGERYYDIYAPIEVADVRLGTVRLGYSYGAVKNEIAVARKQMLVIGLVTAVIGGVVAYFLAGFISFPIKKITNAIGKVADGDLDTALTIKREDEIGALANSFNKMTQDLRKTTISKDYVDNIIGSMNDTLIVVDPQGKIRSVNRATCDLLGYAEDELVGKDIGLVVASEEPIFRMETNHSQHGRARLANHEVNYITKNARQIPMLLSEAVLRDKEERVIGIAGLARDIEERKKAEEALRESEKRLRSLSSQLLTVQEEERRRLSAELHDELGQALVLFKINLRAIQRTLGEDQDQLREECEDLIAYINEVTENVRRLSRDLSPVILEDLGFAAALRRLVESFAKHSNIETSLDIADIEDLLPKKAQIIAYRIVQECFTNIARHSQAKNVSFEIVQRDARLVFCVEDDGIGFNVEDVLGTHSMEKGLGLPAMFQRTQMLHGSLDVRSQQGEGTIVTCSIPINSGGN